VDLSAAMQKDHSGTHALGLDAIAALLKEEELKRFKVEFVNQGFCSSALGNWGRSGSGRYT